MLPSSAWSNFSLFCYVVVTVNCNRIWNWFLNWLFHTELFCRYFKTKQNDLKIGIRFATAADRTYHEFIISFRFVRYEKICWIEKTYISNPITWFYYRFDGVSLRGGEGSLILKWNVLCVRVCCRGKTLSEKWHELYCRVLVSVVHNDTNSSVVFHWSIVHTVTISTYVAVMVEAYLLCQREVESCSTGTRQNTHSWISNTCRNET